MKTEAEVRSIIDLEDNQSFSAEKIKVNFKNFHFGFLKSRRIIVVFYILISLIQITLFLLLRPSTIKIKNLTRVFILGTETSNTLSLLNLYMLETVLYNNTLEGWDGKSTLETYDHLRNHFKTNILESYTDIMELNLGVYNEFYREKVIGVRN